MIRPGSQSIKLNGGLSTEPVLHVHRQSRKALQRAVVWQLRHPKNSEKPYGMESSLLSASSISTNLLNAERVEESA